MHLGPVSQEPGQGLLTVLFKVEHFSENVKNPQVDDERSPKRVLRLRILGKSPEERPRELHPALFRRHLQRHWNRFLPLGPHAQPEPPAETPASGGGFPDQTFRLRTYLQRISEFMQALRS